MTRFPPKSPLTWHVLLLLLSGCLPLPAPETSSPGTAPSTPHAGSTAAQDAPPERGASASKPRPEAPGGWEGGRPPTPGERLLFEPIFRDAERLLGRTEPGPLPRLWIMDQATIAKGMVERMDEEQFGRLRALYTTLGMLPPDMDVKAALRALMQEQVLAFYDPKARVVVVAEVVLDEHRTPTPQREAALIHECLHVLQDRRFGLDQMMRSLEQQPLDVQNAFRTAVEGDAMLGSIFFGLRQRIPERDPVRLAPLALGVTQPAYETWVDASWEKAAQHPLVAAMGPQLAAAPPLLRAPLLFAYLAGAVYAARQVQRGGPVSLALDEAPQCTLAFAPQRGSQPRTCPSESTLPLPEASVPEGWEPVLEETLGWLESGIFLASSDEHDIVDLPWRGDRLRLYRGPEGQHAVLWRMRFADRKASGEALRHARRSVQGLAGHAAEQRGEEVWLSVGWPGRRTAREVLRSVR